MSSQPADADAIIGCLLGQAVGDMMGLPAENLSSRRVTKLVPTFDRPRFLFGYGMGSDDTEHACLTAQALLRSGGDYIEFDRALRRGFRWWFAAGPPGCGLATARAGIRSWLGFRRTGVRSAGNGPAMRAAILFVTNGVYHNWLLRTCGDIQVQLNITPFLGNSAQLTHTDWQAEDGALAVYWAALYASESRGGPIDLYGSAESNGLFFWLEMPRYDSDIDRNIRLLRPALVADKSVADFASDIGLSHGVSGYIAHTVPVAVYAFLRHPDDYRSAVESVIRLGGDTDTVAAITGALVGARVGKAGIPKEWLDRWIDWPRSVAHIEELGRRLAEGKWRTEPQPAVPLAWWAVPFRNLFFFLVVLGHLARRCLPPY